MNSSNIKGKHIGGSSDEEGMAEFEEMSSEEDNNNRMSELFQRFKRVRLMNKITSGQLMEDMEVESDQTEDSTSADDLMINEASSSSSSDNEAEVVEVPDLKDEDDDHIMMYVNYFKTASYENNKGQEKEKEDTLAESDSLQHTSSIVPMETSAEVEGEEDIDQPTVNKPIEMSARVEDEEDINHCINKTMEMPARVEADEDIDQHINKPMGTSAQVEGEEDIDLPTVNKGPVIKLKELFYSDDRPQIFYDRNKIFNSNKKIVDVNVPSQVQLAKKHVNTATKHSLGNQIESEVITISPIRTSKHTKNPNRKLELIEEKILYNLVEKYLIFKKPIEIKKRRYQTASHLVEELTLKKTCPRNLQKRLITNISINAKQITHFRDDHAAQDYVRLIDIIDPLKFYRELAAKTGTTFNRKQTKNVSRCQLLHDIWQADETPEKAEPTVSDNAKQQLNYIWTSRQSWLEDNHKVHPCCTEVGISEKTHFDGFTLGELLMLYIEIRGTYHVPECLVDTAERVISYLYLTVEHAKLRREMNNGTLLKTKNLVIWPYNNMRSLSELFHPIMPEGYHIMTSKRHLVKFLNNEPDTSNRKFKCQACQQRFVCFYTFAAHFAFGKNEISYMCRHCGFLRFSNACSLIYHILTDRVDGPNCEVCIFCQRDSISLRYHFIKHNEEWLVRCLKCNYLSTNPCSFVFNHLIHLKGFCKICPECGEYFIYEGSLKHHMRTVCIARYKSTFYKCCDVVFSNIHSFNQHLKEHIVKLPLCPTCNKCFEEYLELKDHVSKEHPEFPLATKIYTYHWCNICCTQWSNYENHVKRHAEKQCIVGYKCHCQFVSGRRAMFIAHMNEHREGTYPDRPHFLKFCPKCNDLRPYNWKEPFKCERCQIYSGENLCNVYECALCHVIIDYNFSDVLDHFFEEHKEIDLDLVPDNLFVINMISPEIIPGNKAKKSLPRIAFHDANLTIVLHAELDECLMSYSLPYGPNIVYSVLDPSPKYDKLRNYLIPNLLTLNEKQELRPRKDVLNIVHKTESQIEKGLGNSVKETVKSEPFDCPLSPSLEGPTSESFNHSIPSINDDNNTALLLSISSVESLNPSMGKVNI